MMKSSAPIARHLIWTQTHDHLVLEKKHIISPGNRTTTSHSAMHKPLVSLTGKKKEIEARHEISDGCPDKTNVWFVDSLNDDGAISRFHLCSERHRKITVEGSYKPVDSLWLVFWWHYDNRNGFLAALFLKCKMRTWLTGRWGRMQIVLHSFHTLTAFRRS